MAELGIEDGAGLVVFDDATGAPVDPPRPGRLAPAAAVGRPRLGVVAREVTLLPRHWNWLCTQPGGASATLRRLVEDARRRDGGEQLRREARDRTYRAMSAIAGNLPGFEEAARALYAGGPDARARFTARIARWPADLQDYLGGLAAAAFESDAARRGDDIPGPRASA